MQRLSNRAEDAIRKTAEEGAAHIKATAPKAFGDLRSSVHVEDSGESVKIVVDAPHAGAVEIGSAPHNPDIEALTEWVRLRGMQGLRNLRSSRLHGPTTAGHAQTIKEMLAERVVKADSGQFSPIDAPRQVAEAIAAAIRKEGTKPHFYTRNSLPVISMRLATNMRKAMGK